MKKGGSLFSYHLLVLWPHAQRQQELLVPHIREAGRLHPAAELRARRRLAPGLGARLNHEVGDAHKGVVGRKGLVVGPRADLPVLELGPAAGRRVSSCEHQKNKIK